MESGHHSAEVDETTALQRGPTGGSVGQGGTGNSDGDWDGSVDTAWAGIGGSFQLVQKYFIVSATRISFQEVPAGY